MNNLLSSIARNALALSLFAFVTAGVVIIAWQATGERIEHNIRQAQAKALNEIVPVGSYDNDILNDSLSLSGLDSTLLGPLKASDKLLVARQGGQVRTLLFPVVAPDGYTQEIRLLVGIHANGQIAGVRVTEHRETPGLGDKIELKKSAWVKSFEGKSLASPTLENWAVKKDGGDFDQFTGATITPRAVVKAVKQSLKFFEANKDRLLEESTDGKL